MSHYFLNPSLFRGRDVLTIQIFVYSEKDKNVSTLSLYATTKQILQLHQIESFKVNVINFGKTVSYHILFYLLYR